VRTCESSQAAEDTTHVPMPRTWRITFEITAAEECVFQRNDTGANAGSFGVSPWLGTRAESGVFGLRKSRTHLVSLGICLPNAGAPFSQSWFITVLVDHGPG
jgi:hypothetical protein